MFASWKRATPGAPAQIAETWRYPGSPLLQVVKTATLVARHIFANLPRGPQHILLTTRRKGHPWAKYRAIGVEGFGDIKLRQAKQSTRLWFKPVLCSILDSFSSREFVTDEQASPTQQHSYVRSWIGAPWTPCASLRVTNEAFVGWTQTGCCSLLDSASFGHSFGHSLEV